MYGYIAAPRQFTQTRTPALQVVVARECSSWYLGRYVLRTDPESLGSLPEVNLKSQNAQPHLLVRPTYPEHRATSVLPYHTPYHAQTHSHADLGS